LQGEPFGRDSGVGPREVGLPVMGFVFPIGSVIYPQKAGIVGRVELFFLRLRVDGNRAIFIVRSGFGARPWSGGSQVKQCYGYHSHALNVKVSRAAAAARQKNERSEREDFRDAGVVGTAEGAVNHDADVAPFERFLAVVDKRDG